MTNAEINRKVLEIIGWISPKPEQHISPPDFFAQEANPMPLIRWCERNDIVWQLGLSLEGRHYATIRSRKAGSDYFTEYDANISVAAFARAIVQQKEGRE